MKLVDFLALFILLANYSFASSLPCNHIKWTSAEDVAEKCSAYIKEVRDELEQDSNYITHHRPPCKEILRFNNHVWEFYLPWNLMGDYFFEKIKNYPSGITGEYSIVDSTLYLTKIKICFSGTIIFDEGETFVPLEIPLNVIFEGVKDSIVASYYSGMQSFTCFDCDHDKYCDNSHPSLDVLVENGKILYQTIINPVCIDSNNQPLNAPKYVAEDSTSYKIINNGRIPKDFDYIYGDAFKEYMKRFAPYYQKQRELEKGYRDSVEKVKP